MNAMKLNFSRKPQPRRRIRGVARTAGLDRTATDLELSRLATSAAGSLRDLDATMRRYLADAGNDYRRFTEKY